MTTYTVGAEPRCFAIVPCAGTGSRAGSFQPKQYTPVAGLPLVAHTLAALARVERLAGILVVLAEDDTQFEEDLPGLVDAADGRLWLAKVGGATRAETVANGLNELRARGAQPQDWVLVHDAARCLLRPAWVDRLIDACQDDEVGGLLALPVADTLKAEEAGRVAATVDRNGKWAAQTPQMFRLGLLAPALAFAGEQVTDEASAIEALGHSPKLVRGDYENFKVTWPGDFALAERLLSTAQRGAELRAYVPARDFALSQRFYEALGFAREFAQGGLAGYRMGQTAFLLQDAFEPAQAANARMHLTLDDLPAFWTRLEREGVLGQFAEHGVRAEAPRQQPWGLLDMTLTDPSGVLWRIAQRMEVAE